jgi:prepilin-type N-terminal cleavage/methylation domain-containing protein
MDKKAFTLTELIVVVTILAIIWLISFISIQWFTIDARNSKRISDARSLIAKITIENSRWIDYKDIMNSNPKSNSLTINWEEGKEWFQNTGNPINWNVLRENWDNFKDPLTWNHYPFAFTEWNAGGVWYSFIQLAYMEEKTGKTKLVWTYYEMQPWDSPSLFTNEGWNWENIPDDYIIDDVQTPYEPITPPAQINNNCERNPDFDWYNVPAINHLETTEELEKEVGEGNIKWKATFTCVNWEFTKNEEILDYWSSRCDISVTENRDSDNDITIWNYQIMDRNLGATSNDIYSSTSYWCFFQWWNNFPFGTWALIKVTKSTWIDTSWYWPSNYYSSWVFMQSYYIDWRLDWSNPTNNDLWWDITNTNMARKWPCPSWYHIPTQDEWQWIITSWSWWFSRPWGWSSDVEKIRNFILDLKLPWAGLINQWEYSNHYHDKEGDLWAGYYWTSTPFTHYDNTRSRNLRFNYLTGAANGVILHWADDTSGERRLWFSIRCFKN